eukprot:scaffold87854_cov62-Phaeocystis_antarctica.AAC.1
MGGAHELGMWGRGAEGRRRASTSSSQMRKPAPRRVSTLHSKAAVPERIRRAKRRRARLRPVVSAGPAASARAAASSRVSSTSTGRSNLNPAAAHAFTAAAAVLSSSSGASSAAAAWAASCLKPSLGR